MFALIFVNKFYIKYNILCRQKLKTASYNITKLQVLIKVGLRNVCTYEINAFVYCNNAVIVKRIGEKGRCQKCNFSYSF